MNKNEQVSKLDHAQIQKRMYDPEMDAQRVRVIHSPDVETKISLNHKENDSVAAMSACRIIPAHELVDCSDLQKVQAFCTALVTLYGPGDMAVSKSLSAGDILEICALKIKCDVALVGR